MIGISDRPWQDIPGVTTDRTILLSPRITARGVEAIAAVPGPLILLGSRARRLFGLGPEPDSMIFYDGRFVLSLPHGKLQPDALRLARTFAMTFGVQ